MSTRGERISPNGTRECEDILYGYLRRPPASDSEKDMAEYSRRKLAWEYFSGRYRKANAGVKLKNAPEGVTMLTYKSLASFLDLSGLTISEAYVMCYPDRKDELLPTDDVKKLGQVCDALPNGLRQRILATADELMPEFVKSSELVNGNIKTRVRKVAMRTLLAEEIQNAPAVIRRFIKDRHDAMQISFSDTPLYARYLGVSIHWLMMPNDRTVTTYGNSIDTQLILDAYGMMSSSMKQWFFDAVMLASERGLIK